MKDLPLGKKAYSKIPHLPGSRTGSSDRVAAPQLARRCTVECAPGEVVVVQEKLDGSCVAVAMKNGEILALGREGWRAELSNNPGRRMFARWVKAQSIRFSEMLREGEWIVGEWLALAHSTRYELKHEPFVVFDLCVGEQSLSTKALEARLGGHFARPHLLHSRKAVGVEFINEQLGELGHHGALDRAEGAMWRVERGDLVVTRAKFVRPGKVDGSLLPENSGKPAVWNWSDGVIG